MCVMYATVMCVVVYECRSVWHLTVLEAALEVSETSCKIMVASFMVKIRLFYALKASSC